MRPLAALAVVGLVLLGAACGGSSSGSSTTTTAATASSTVTWANGVCTALLHYRTKLHDARTSIRAAGVSKDSVKQAADAIGTATQSFVDEVQGLAKPGTAAAATAKKTVDQLATELQTEAKAVQDAVATGTPTLSVLSTVQTSIARAKSALSTAADRLQQLDAKGELKNAFSHAPSCATAIGS